MQAQYKQFVSKGITPPPSIEDEVQATVLRTFGFEPDAITLQLYVRPNAVALRSLVA